MANIAVLGIDCGGTHTDAALLEVDETSGKASLICSAKIQTRHDDLPQTVLDLINILKNNENAIKSLSRLDRITLGTTLEVNSLIEGKADKVALALSAGPGLNPIHFTIGSCFCIVPGGLDHRGQEVGSLNLSGLKKDAALWPKEGVAAIACVGKFSPRNPAHEIIIAETAHKISGLPVSMGHSLSGKLDFPRRIATTYYNAAVERLHGEFLGAMEDAFRKAGLGAQCRLLKADGGAITFSVSRKQAVQSILSGPAASVMGALATWPGSRSGCSLLLDMGGTTTDIALFYDGSPVLNRNGMYLLGRHTLIRSLASVSIGIGGDSLLRGKMNESGPQIQVGPERLGPALAFGGPAPTLLDALNALDGAEGSDRGDISASIKGMQDFTRSMNLSEDQLPYIAEICVEQALATIRHSAYELLEEINSRPIYTLAALKAIPEARPTKACIVGGPAHCIRERLEKSLALPVEIGPHPEVANAIGAALVKPTASLEIYADTGTGRLLAPSLDLEEKIPPRFTLEQAKERACQLLKAYMDTEGITGASVEVVESDLFATLDDYGRGARDMRVTVQAKPGIVAALV